MLDAVARPARTPRARADRDAVVDVVEPLVPLVERLDVDGADARVALRAQIARSSQPPMNPPAPATTIRSPRAMVRVSDAFLGT